MTRNRFVYRFVLLPALVICTRIAIEPVAAQPVYTVTDLGSLDGTLSSGMAINASGQVTGWSYADGGFIEHAFLHDGTMHDLGTLGGTRSYGHDINATGLVTGYSHLASGYDHAFLFDGTLHDLGDPWWTRQLWLWH